MKSTLNVVNGKTLVLVGTNSIIQNRNDEKPHC